MARLPLKTIRRQSLWEVYNKRCFYCGELLFLLDCEVDHILSQDLKKKPDELRRILNYYHLSDNFEIDSLENQVPCHPSCNKKKGNKRYSKRTINFYIEQALSNSKKVAALENNYKAALLKDSELGLIQMILKRGLLTKSEIISFVEYHEQLPLSLSDKTHVITFSVNIEDLFESDSLPDSAPRQYVYLCDWLHENLVTHLASIISTPFYPVEDKRDGETFGLRIVFFNLSKKEFTKFSRRWWEIFHEGTFTEVYNKSPSKYFNETKN